LEEVVLLEEIVLEDRVEGTMKVLIETGPEETIGQALIGRCILWFVINVVKAAKFLLNQLKENLCIVIIVSRKMIISAQEDQMNLKMI